MPETLSDSIVAETVAAETRWRGEHPFYRRLVAGEVSRETYAAWLIEMHRYIRYSVAEEQALASKMARLDGDEAQQLRAYAEWEAAEEATHDDLILGDLARLWAESEDGALGRIERTPPAPATAAWQRTVDAMTGQHPEGVLGFALALETIASRCTDDIRSGLLAHGDDDVAEAVSFLAAHSAEVEDGHTGEGRAAVDRVTDPTGRAAIRFYAVMGRELFHGILDYLHELHAGERA